MAMPRETPKGSRDICRAISFAGWNWLSGFSKLALDQGPDRIDHRFWVCGRNRKSNGIALANLQTSHIDQAPGENRSATGSPIFDEHFGWKTG